VGTPVELHCRTELPPQIHRYSSIFYHSSLTREQRIYMLKDYAFQQSSKLPINEIMFSKALDPFLPAYCVLENHGV
jgi:hypothetical protein